MDVCLWIQPDGRFSVEPTAMWSEPGDLVMSRHVDDLLVASGARGSGCETKKHPGTGRWAPDTH